MCVTRTVVNVAKLSERKLTEQLAIETLSNRPISHSADQKATAVYLLYVEKGYNNPKYVG